MSTHNIPFSISIGINLEYSCIKMSFGKVGSRLYGHKFRFTAMQNTVCNHRTEIRLWKIKRIKVLKCHLGTLYSKQTLSAQ